MYQRYIKWILFGFVSIVLAAPSQAQENAAPEPSSRYRVVGVAPSDQLTPVDVYFGRRQIIQEMRGEIKCRTMEQRRRNQFKAAA